ncbi:hypothetical protein DFH29DRAFT_336737 [Suillus ampliporus]|nr:hypothetical protein DFH29DRAFT_336737 [Suillus ampliporus]
MCQLVKVLPSPVRNLGARGIIEPIRSFLIHQSYLTYKVTISQGVLFTDRWSTSSTSSGSQGLSLVSQYRILTLGSSISKSPLNIHHSIGVDSLPRKFRAKYHMLHYSTSMGSIHASLPHQDVNNVFVVVVTIVVYDFMTNVDVELDYLLNSRPTLAKGLFLGCRYIPFVICALHLAMVLSWGVEACPGLAQSNILFLGILLLCAECVFVLRTYALWNRDRRVRNALLIVFLAFLCGVILLVVACGILFKTAICTSFQVEVIAHVWSRSYSHNRLLLRYSDTNRLYSCAIHPFVTPRNRSVRRLLHDLDFQLKPQLLLRGCLSHLLQNDKILPCHTLPAFVVGCPIQCRLCPWWAILHRNQYHCNLLCSGRLWFDT